MVFKLDVCRDNPLIKDKDTYNFKIEFRPIFDREDDYLIDTTATVFIRKGSFWPVLYESIRFCEFAKNVQETINTSGGFINVYEFEMDDDDYKYFKECLKECVSEDDKYDFSRESVRDALDEVVSNWFSNSYSEDRADEYLINMYTDYADSGFYITDVYDFE